MKETVYQENDFVLHEGDMGDEIYVVYAGKFSCEKKGQREVLKVYEAGGIFGEISLLYNSPRTSTIKTKTAGKLFSLQRRYFFNVIRGTMIAKLR